MNEIFNVMSEADFERIDQDKYLIGGIDQCHYFTLRALSNRMSARGNVIDHKEMTMYRLQFLAQSSWTIINQTINWLISRKLVVCHQQNSKQTFRKRRMDTYEITERGRQLLEMLTYEPYLQILISEETGLRR